MLSCHLYTFILTLYQSASPLQFLLCIFLLLIFLSVINQLLPCEGCSLNAFSFSYFCTVANFASFDIFCFELGCYFSIILVLYYVYIKTTMEYLIWCIKAQIHCLSPSLWSLTLMSWDSYRLCVVISGGLI